MGDILRRMITIVISTATLLLGLLACGRESERSPSTSPPAPSPPASVTNSESPPVMPTKVHTAAPVPIDTMFAESYEIPTHLAARSLRLRLRSNVSGASFECRQTAHAVWGTRCTAGDEFWVDNLVHGNTYRFEIRAVSPAGLVDPSPLVVLIYVDFVTGSPLSVGSTGRGGAGVAIPEAVSDLPAYRASQTDAGAGSSAVALGPSLAFVLPIGHRVTSYATDLTYNGRIKLFLAMQSPSSEVPRCDQTWERLVTGPQGETFCDATPRRTDLETVYRQPLPRNHIETYSGSPKTPDEKLFVAAYGDRSDELDAAEARYDAIDQCPNATLKGNAPLPVVTRQLGGQVREQMDWCLVRGSDGAWWWVGRFKGKLAPGKGRVVALYAVKGAVFGLQSSQSFVVRTADLMRNVLVPLGKGS